MNYCDACAQLRDFAEELLLLGVTDKSCNSLKVDTGLNPDLSVLHNNCDDLGIMNDCLIAMFSQTISSYDDCDYKAALVNALNNIHTMNTAILCGDCGQWEQIWLLWEEIRNLYELINAISGGNYSYLTPGTDYTCTMWNSWYTDSTYVRVGYIETTSQVNLLIQSPLSASQGWPAYYFRLYNEDIIANNVTQRHAESAADIPLSWIYSINFAGDYSGWNDLAFRNTTPTASGIWNLTPVAERLSWQANCPLSNNVTGTSSKLTCSIAQYADGYNTQFTQYGLDSIRAAGINLDASCILFKS